MEKAETRRIINVIALNIIVGILIFQITGSFSNITAQGKGPEPQVFEAGVVSTGHEFGLTFAPDQKEAFFTRNFAEKKLNHIMQTKKEIGKWQEPVPISFSDDQWSDLDPSLSPNGKRLFFVSTRPVPGAQDAKIRNMDIWYSDRTNGIWGKPQHLENVNSPAKEGSPSVSKNGTLCFFSDRGREANSNSIYCSEPLGGKYGEPKKLGSEINSETSDTSPFLSADGKVLLFYSTRPGGYGQADLYVSFRQSNGGSAATNLGQIVNTPEWEYNPIISPDGKTLYFGRNRNIYWVRTKSLNIPGLGSKPVQPK